MKVFLPILLLLVTSLYILPVKEMFYGHTDVCLTDMDTDKDDCSKKEKAKELFSYNIPVVLIKKSHCIPQYYLSPAIPSLLHTVETPPPDRA
jgi:hypothetical protein